jgi:non-heme chloroperoxidase
MNTITTKDGVEIFYKDLGKGQPIVFSHGWPLSADDWDTQMLFFLGKGFRVIAHDRRGHGRSTQTGDGHDMDHYADDLATLTAHLDLKDAVHVGHSTGGGEVPQRDGKVFACLPVAIRSRVVRKPIGALRRPPYF